MFAVLAVSFFSVDLPRQHCRPPIYEYTIRNKNPKNSDCEISWGV